MKKFARIENGVVREIISRPNDFNITRAYYTSLISDGLGGSAGPDEGFVKISLGDIVNEDDLFSAGQFSPAPPLPPPPTQAENTENELTTNLTWRAWVARQAKIESKTVRQIINELKVQLP